MSIYEFNLMECGTLVGKEATYVRVVGEADTDSEALEIVRHNYPEDLFALVIGVNTDGTPVLSRREEKR